MYEYEEMSSTDRSNQIEIFPDVASRNNQPVSTSLFNLTLINFNLP